MRQTDTGSTLKGPLFDRKGNLYFTEVRNARIFRVSPDAVATLVAEYDGEPNGLKIHKDGRIFVTDHHHGLMLLDPERGRVEPLMGGTEKERFKGVDDLVFASNGDLYFTDQGAAGLHDPTGRGYRLSAQGERTCIIDTVPSPNGIVFNLSETVLFVAAIRASAVWHVPLSTRGGAAKVGAFAKLPASGPDGLALNIESNLAAVNSGLGVVWLFDRRGLPIYLVDSCAGAHVTNIAYGGPGNRWLYMVEGDSSSILRAEMPFPAARCSPTKQSDPGSSRSRQRSRTRGGGKA